MTIMYFCVLLNTKYVYLLIAMTDEIVYCNVSIPRM